MTSLAGSKFEPVKLSRPARATGLLMGWMLAFAASLALYAGTASRHIEWMDSGFFVLRVVRGQLLNPLGLALSHPLHFWIGTLFVRLLPLQAPFAMALVSSVFGAIAVANVFGVVLQLTRRRDAAAMAALTLLFANTFWRMSTIVETYTLVAALLTAEIWMLVRWDQIRNSVWLVLMFLFNGLGLATHDLALLTLPVLTLVLVAAVWKKEVSWRIVTFAGAVWLIGASPFLGFVAYQGVVTHDIGRTLHSALFGNYQDGVTGRALVPAYTAASVAFTLLSFPNLTLPAALLGMLRWRRVVGARMALWALLGAFGIHLLFVLRYGVITQYNFLVPSYALLAIFAGVGYARVLSAWRPRVARVVVAFAVVLPCVSPALDVLTADVARHFQVLGAYARAKPYRDDYRYLLIPWGCDDSSAQRMSVQAAELAGRDGLILAPDGMGSWAIEYQVFAQHKPDVLVAAGAEPAMIEQRMRHGAAVVFVPFHAGDAPPTSSPGHWQREGDLYLLVSDATARHDPGGSADGR